MKKIFIICLCIVLSAGFAGCKGAGDSPDTGDDILDLTMLSGIMVYSEVYNMMMKPEDYIGRTVKMQGAFSVFYEDSTGRYYFSCIIADATACCSQGIEFELAGNFSFPEDYPEEGAEITVTGTFDTYAEGQFTYCVLRNAALE